MDRSDGVFMNPPVSRLFLHFRLKVSVSLKNEEGVNGRKELLTLSEDTLKVSVCLKAKELSTTTRSKVSHSERKTSGTIELMELCGETLRGVFTNDNHTDVRHVSHKSVEMKRKVQRKTKQSPL